MVIQLTTNYWLVLSYAFIIFYALCTIYSLAFFISSHFHLCSFEHLLSCHFYFAHLRFSFPFLRYLIININPKKFFNGTWTIWLLSLALWSMGLFLGLRIKNLGLSWRPCDLIWLFLSVVLEYYLKTLGCLFVFVCMFFVITLFVCNLEFTRIQPLLCPIFVKT